MKKSFISAKAHNRKIDELAIFLKIIADETRLRILILLLKEGEKCVCEIWLFLGMPQNLVSHHLLVLKNFGLLAARKEGKWTYYSAVPKTIQIYRSYLEQFLTDTERTSAKASCCTQKES